MVYTLPSKVYFNSIVYLFYNQIEMIEEEEPEEYEVF